MQLTEHFTLEEMTRSSAATRKSIDNTPTPEITENLRLLCEKVLEPLRSSSENAIRVTSGYRCEKLNKLIGGAKNSHHVKGMAADITEDSWTVEDLFQKIKNSDLKWTQLIQEFSEWTHVSYDPNDLKCECLRATKVNGKTVYTKA